MAGLPIQLYGGKVSPFLKALFCPLALTICPFFLKAIFFYTDVIFINMHAVFLVKRNLHIIQKYLYLLSHACITCQKCPLSVQHPAPFFSGLGQQYENKPIHLSPRDLHVLNCQNNHQFYCQIQSNTA